MILESTERVSQWRGLLCRTITDFLSRYGRGILSRRTVYCRCYIERLFCESRWFSYRLNAWCAATQNMAFIELEAGDKPLHLNLDFVMDESMGAQLSNGCTDDINWYVRKFDSQTLEWPTAVSVGMFTLDNKNLSGLLLEKAKSFLLFYRFVQIMNSKLM